MAERLNRNPEGTQRELDRLIRFKNPRIQTITCLIGLLASLITPEPAKASEHDEDGKTTGYLALQVGASATGEVEETPFSTTISYNGSFATIYKGNFSCIGELHEVGAELGISFGRRKKVALSFGGDMVIYEGENCGDGKIEEWLPGEAHAHIGLSFPLGRHKAANVSVTPGASLREPIHGFALGISGDYLSFSVGLAEDHLTESEEWFGQFSFALGDHLKTGATIGLDHETLQPHSLTLSVNVGLGDHSHP